MSNSIRVAICQIECHPAVVVGDRDYLAEPFLGAKNDPCLADISRYGLDLAAVQDECRTTYAEWHSRRLTDILSWLSLLNPSPDVVVFPECSIPIHDLYLTQDFAKTNDCVVFSGTHTLRQTAADADHYKSLGIKRKKRESFAGQSLLPVFCGSNTYHHVKSFPSVFEQKDFSVTQPVLNTLEPMELRFRQKQLRFLPVVCSEALGLSTISSAYDLVVIVAHNDGIAPFMPTISHNVQNQIPVIFCNDGRYGESSAHAVIDRRMTGVWWWNEPIRGLLPRGDAVLVVDLDLTKQNAQFGVANPTPSTQLVKVAPIVVPNGGDGFTNASELARLSLLNDNTVQRQVIAQLLQVTHPGQSQLYCMQHLERLCKAGSATTEWWSTIGDSILQSSSSGLEDIEAVAAKRCIDALELLLTNGETDDESLLGKLARLKRACLRKLSSSSAPRSADKAGEGLDIPLDRESETKTIRMFLDGKSQKILCVTGLDDVGKATVVALALKQGGRTGSLWIALASDATPEFIVASLMREFHFAGSPQLEHLGSETFTNAIPYGTVVVIVNADNLKDHGAWRDARSPTLIQHLADGIANRKGKLIVISSVRLDFESITPSALARVWLKGLPAEHGVTLLDQHLRRAGLDPTEYDNDERKRIVEAVGGHPGAIILASEYSQQIGLLQVASDLERRRGVHTEIVHRILQRLQFTEEEEEVFSLLSEARVAIPAATLNGVVKFNPSPVVNSLIRLCVVERKRNDDVQVVDLVRGYCDSGKLAAGSITLFHKAAAEACRRLAGDQRSSEELMWAVEAKFHAQMAGDMNLAPVVSNLLDGSLGAVHELIDAHQYERARPVVEQLLKHHQSAELYQLAALVFVRLGDCDEALSLAKEAISREPTRHWVLTEVGRLALHVHRDDVADQCIQLAKRTGFDSSYLATLEGKIALRRSGEAGAVDAFRRAVTLSDLDERRKDAWPHFFLGRTLLKLGHHEEAIDVLYRGESMATSRHRPHRHLITAIRTQLAIAYVYSGELESAKQVLDLVMATEKSAEVIWAMALYRAASGQTGNAIDAAKLALKELDPNTAKDRYGKCQVYLFRALVFLATNNPSRASEEFSRAHLEDPRNVFVLLRWANTLVELANISREDGEVEAARHCAEHAKVLADKVLEFDRENAQALALLEKLADDFNVL